MPFTLSDGDVRQLEARMRNDGILYDGEYPICVALTPYLLPQKRYVQLTQRCEFLLSGIERVLRAFVTSPDSRRFFPELRDLAATAATPPPYEPWIQLARFDLIEDANGEFRVIETNCDCPGGLILNALLKRTLASIQGWQCGLDEVRPVPQQIDSLDFFPRHLAGLGEAFLGPGFHSLGFISSRYRSITNELKIFVRAASESGFPACHSVVQDLSFECGQLRCGDHPIHSAYQKFDAFVDAEGRAQICIHEHDRTEARAYWQAVEAGGFVYVNSFPSSLIAESKRVLEALRLDPFSQLLKDPEIEARDALVPHTQSLACLDSSPHHVLNRERGNFVIKAPIDTRGRSVTIGALTNAASWESRISEGRLRNDVVQNYIETKRIGILSSHSPFVPEPMFRTLSLFLVGGKAVGMFARCSPHPVTNVSRGGLLQTVYVVPTDGCLST